MKTVARIFASAGAVLAATLSWTVFLSQSADAGEASLIQATRLALQQQTSAIDCGRSLHTIEFYKNLSTYSLAGAFAFIFPAILVDRKKLKLIFAIASLPLLGLWTHTHFFVDLEQMQKDIFAYNVQTEEALANIAEGQERYKSEHGFYLNDLGKLYSHLAGAHGINRCVQILDLEVSSGNWSATARHRSSPDIIFWDGKSGSSLKKG